MTPSKDARERMAKRDDLIGIVCQKYKAKGYLACGKCDTPCEATRCPECHESLIYPRGDYPYCEECGWPDEILPKE
jgi:hypothetical protein